jgi:endonuclease/exonuclease/phosphatase family metal-dependent hydrolase
MKNFLLLLSWSSFLLFSGCTSDSEKKPFTVMSFNIRYDNPGDGVNAWKHRMNLAGRTIRDEKAILIGMQEVLKGQLDDIDSLLPGYNHVGVGRDDGKEGGEYNPVYFDTKRFELLKQATFWLSETPQDTGSVGWDAALPRIATWAKFRDMVTDQAFYFINTHLDHMGDTARLESARLILDFIAGHTQGLPVILTGDFNCEPAEAPYKLVTTGEDRASGLGDACLSVRRHQPDPEGTFNGFGNANPQPRIDFIFINDRWDVLDFRTVKAKEGEVFISDHYPVDSKVSYRERR